MGLWFSIASCGCAMTLFPRGSGLYQTDRFNPTPLFRMSLVFASASASAKQRTRYNNLCSSPNGSLVLRLLASAIGSLHFIQIGIDSKQKGKNKRWVVRNVWDMRLLTAMDGHGWSCACEPHMQIAEGIQKRLRARKGTPKLFTFFSPCLPSLPRSFFSPHWAADGPGLVFGVCFHSCHWLLFISRVAVVQSWEPELRNSSFLARLACHLPTVHGCLAQLHSHRTRSVRL